MKKIDSKDWFLEITRNMSFFQACLDLGGHYFFSKNYGLLPKSRLIIVKNGRRSFIFSNYKETKKYYQKLEKVCLSKRKFKKLENTYYKFGERLLRASKQLEKKQNLNSFKNFIKAEKQLAAGLYLTTAIGCHMSALLRRHLKKIYPHLSEAKMDSVISLITYPKRYSYLTQSQISLLDIGMKLQRKKITVKNIKYDHQIYQEFKNWLQKYSIIPVNWNEEPWQEKDCLNQLESLMRSNCQKEKEKILKEHREKIKKAAQLLDEIKNKKIKLIAHSLQVGSFLNEYRKYIFSRASLAYRPLFQKITQKYQLADWRELWKFTPEEIVCLYFKNQTDLLRVLPKRNLIGLINKKNQQGYVLLNRWQIKPFLRKIRENTSRETKKFKIKEIKGIITNPGSICGVVKIIQGKKDFNKFKNRDIIVAPMTSVDFVPLMKRASAFITDEGGITSHAAIISRELGIPCLVGTKIATRVLKDGDLVEVDANKGVVKILKKQNENSSSKRKWS